MKTIILTTTALMQTSAVCLHSLWLYIGIGAVTLLVAVLLILIHTYRRRLRQHIEKMEQMADENSQLQSAFIANMSHEIRTPLNAIVGFTTLLTETEGMGAEERQMCAREITFNKDILLQLVSDLLDYSRIECGSLEYHDGEVDLNALIEEICQSRNALRSDSEVKVSFTERIPGCRLSVDRVRFSQVLDNLISNALKFTEQGGVTVGYRRQGSGKFYFYVTDTGCGIDEEARKAIFDRFVKMRAHIRGTGLGLPITKSIVEHYGGGIGVESKQGEGSTFYFTLPAEREYKVYGKF